MFKYDENKIQEGLRLISQIEPSSESISRTVDKIRQTLTSRTRIYSNNRTWRIIIRSPITKLTAAAVIIIAVAAGIHYFAGEGTQKCCAWERIADKVEQFKNCVCRVHVTQKAVGSPIADETDRDMFISTEYGERTDTYYDGNLVSQTFVLPNRKEMITVMPFAKKYQRLQVTDEYAATWKQQRRQNPRDLVKDFMSGEYTELGENTIEGVKVKGIESINPPLAKGMNDNSVGRLWVDVTTEMPVQLEFEYEMSAEAEKIRYSIRMNEFEWNTELDQGIFEPNIPADYILMANMKEPNNDEGSAIEGLRIYAEVTDGNYPSQMNVMVMTQEAQKAMKKKMNLKQVHVESGVTPDDAKMEQIMQKTMEIGSVFLFYNKLAKQGNDPAYYGEYVKVGDANAVLMRWKVTDDTYRVIFGNLSIENIAAEKLKEMEQAAHQ